jgi:hypothetical protein
VGADPGSFRAEASRGLNFYAIASLVVLTASVLPGLWMAPNWASAIDDVILAAIAGAACAWYLDRRNRVRRSPVPLVLLALGLLTKLVGTLLAHWSGGPVSGDASAVVFLTLTTTVTIWQHGATRRRAGQARPRTDDDLLIGLLRQRSQFRRPPKN